MKLLGLLSVFVILTGSIFSSEEPIDSVSSESVDQASYSRLYVCFGKLAVRDDMTWIKGTFHRADGGETTTVHGYRLVPYLEDLDIESIYYFDYPSVYQGVTFEIGPLGSESHWVASDIIKIQDGAYRLDTANYSAIEGTSQWQSISLTQSQFASYILAGIDHDLRDSRNGYMAYPSIKKTFYDAISDYDENKAKNATWTDVYTQETISFYDKWARIKENYEKNRIGDGTEAFMKIIGIAVCLCSASLLFLIVYRNKNGNRKKR